MGTSASFARKAAACLAAVLLAFTLVPASALAGEDVAEPSIKEDQEANSAQVDKAVGASSEADGSASADSSVEAGTLAASLMGRPASFVNADVVLDGEPVIGSFTLDGLTFAVTEGSNVELVGVSGFEVGGSTHATSDAEAEGSASEAAASVIALPESVAYNGAEYAVTSIGAYAFYLSGVTSVELPASIANVDERAFRSSDVASVEVAAGNPVYSSFDGVLYDADRSSLLLIPEGKQGAVLLPKETEVAEAGKFSHCSLVDAISAEDGAAFASENGLLYDASLEMLLRVPAGATDITIREGCTAIAAGAMEGCAKLAIINAPASVTSISPDVFTSVPTVSLPAATLAEDAPQLSAMVALSSIDDDLPKVEPSTVMVCLPDDADDVAWRSAGFGAFGHGERLKEAPIGSPDDADGPEAVTQVAATSRSANSFSVYANYNRECHGRLYVTQDTYAGRTGYQQWSNIYTGGRGKSMTFSGVNYTILTDMYVITGYVVPDEGYWFAGWNTTGSVEEVQFTSRTISISTGNLVVYAVCSPNPYEISLDPNGEGASVDPVSISTVYDAQTALPAPVRPGYRFEGWDTQADGSGTRYQDTASKLTTTSGATVTLYAQWEPYVLDFETSEEPGDEDYPGEEKPSVTVPDIIDDVGKGGIEDPKRPGYVFQGWIIPSEDGTTAIDQDLVYQDETDGKWYVDASKMPDYADDSGRVELTARWTSVISVDVPSAVTFYADVVTQGNESREGAADGAFGQNKVASQSQVDLRIVGLESTAVETQGSTLGADSILKKAASATPSSSTQKLFSLYPTDEALTPDDLQDPGAVSAAKPADAVDFALDDILLEKSFAADKFTIPAGDTLNLGYRLNLQETGTELDYDKLSTLDEGQSASIANISYCFAAGYDAYCFWTYDDDGAQLNVGKIKADADAIAAGDATTTAKYTAWMNADHRFYVKWYDQGLGELDGGLTQGKYSTYEVRIIGINHDDKSDGSGKAGITFQFVNLLNTPYSLNYATCNTAAHYGTATATYGRDDVYGYYDNVLGTNSGSGGAWPWAHNTNKGGWGASLLRARMNEGIESDEILNAGSQGKDDDAIWNQVPAGLKAMLPLVDKRYYDGSINVAENPVALRVSSDRLFIVSYSELVESTNTYMADAISLLNEGDPYEYWESKGVHGTAANSVLAKQQTTNGGFGLGAVWIYHTRTAYPGQQSQFFMIVNTGTLVTGASSFVFGVCPAFCL